MITLIVNADDLGLHPEIDRGIFEAHQDGIVTSSTLLVTGPSAESAVKSALKQHLPLGVHLCLASRLPPAAPSDQVRSLLDEQGRFLPSWRELVVRAARGALNLSEVEIEFRAQIGRIQELGVKPDHLDSHQHLHLLPGIRGVVCRLAIEFNLPLRWPHFEPRLGWLSQPSTAAKTVLILGLAKLSSDPGVEKVRSVGIFEAGNLTEARLLTLIGELQNGLYEIGCHPGRTPREVPEEPGWKYGWEDEFRALISPKVQALLKARGIELQSFQSAFRV